MIILSIDCVSFWKHFQCLSLVCLFWSPEIHFWTAENNLPAELFSAEAYILLQYSMYQVQLIMVIKFCHFSLCTFFPSPAKAFRVPTKPAVAGKRSQQNKEGFNRAAGLYQEFYKDKMVLGAFWMCLLTCKPLSCLVHWAPLGLWLTHSCHMATCPKLGWFAE